MATVEVRTGLTAFGAAAQPATADVVWNDPARRALRVLAGVGACWGLALVTLFIPVAHFLLVPAFLVAGIVVGMRRARERARLVRIRGTCPRCGAALDLAPGGAFEDGRTLSCPHCHHQLTLAVTA